MSDETLDNLIARYLQAEDDLAILGKTIEKSGQHAAVVFVDLVGSTYLKHQVSVPRWLGYVLRFLQLTTSFAARTGGTVVKRIGDELMLTFASATAADAFLLRLAEADEMTHYRFKAAADWGMVFPVSFQESSVLDPYGSIVDRAARIANLATAGTILASSSAFVAELKESSYMEVGKLAMKGIPDQQTVFIRDTRSRATEVFRSELLRTLNNHDKLQPRFRFVPRTFTAADVSIRQHQNAHPFLVRELVSLPLLPLSFAEFVKLRAKQPKKAEEFVGHLVEWDAVFHSAEYQRSGDYFYVSITAGPRGEGGAAAVLMTSEMSDGLKLLREADRVRVRGVLMQSASPLPLLDFADIQKAG